MSANKSQKAVTGITQQPAVGSRQPEGIVSVLMRRCGNQGLQRLMAHVANSKHIPVSSHVQRAAAEKRPTGERNFVWDGGPSSYKNVFDAFDYTIVVIKPDGTGMQYRFVVDRSGDTAMMRLVGGVELTALRVRALMFLDKQQGSFQETAKGPETRRDNDHATGEANRKAWAKLSPANAQALNDYQQRLGAYAAELKAYQLSLVAQGSKQSKPPKPPAPPAPPKGMPEDPRLTLCNAFPPEMGQDIAGDSGKLGNFDPADEGSKRGSWRTLETNPEGPRPGDVYSLGLSKDKKTIMHLGVFRSSRPGPNGKQIWTVVDGGQGAYAARQEVWERTRYFDPVTQLLSTTLADAGQSAEDRSLRGWIDIDVHFKQSKGPLGTELPVPEWTFRNDVSMPVSGVCSRCHLFPASCFLGWHVACTATA